MWKGTRQLWEASSGGVTKGRLPCLIFCLAALLICAAAAVAAAAAADDDDGNDDGGDSFTENRTNRYF